MARIATESAEVAANPQKQTAIACEPTEIVPAPTPFAAVPLSRADEVWNFVRQWQGAYVSPILRPSALPPGLDSIELMALSQERVVPDPAFLAVEYSGAGKSLMILAGGVNPPYAIDAAHEQKATVRGHSVAIVESDTSPTNLSLYWTEPGVWLSPGPCGSAQDHIRYEVGSHGLTPEELLQVANSLRPVTD